jgi:hypothetical protein
MLCRKDFIIFTVVAISSFSLLTVVLVPNILACGNTAHAAGYYEIVRIVEVGPVSGIPVSGPMKWSPDGSHLAFFGEGSLVVVDTLGNYEKVAEIDMQPRRFEWLSDQEVVVRLRENPGENARASLICFDIVTGECRVLEQFSADRPYKRLAPGLPEGEFEGPYLTLQGSLYYYKFHEDNKKIAVLPQSKYRPEVSPERNYIYRVQRGGLYLVRTDLKDSLLAFSKPYADTVQGLNRSQWCTGGFIWRFRDSSAIRLDTIPRLRELAADRLVCGFMFEGLNPKHPEVLFQFSCDVDDYNSERRVILFDYGHNLLTILDDTVGHENCHSPLYSPTGKDIAIRGGHTCFIIMRSEL